MKRLLIILSAGILLTSVALTARERGIKYQINSVKCTGCSKCVEVCPPKASAIMVQNKKAVIDPSRCVGCGKCADRCREGAVVPQG